MNTQQNKEILQDAFHAVFEQHRNDEATVSKYFDRDYQQWVDGHELDFFGLIDHLKVQAERVKQISFKFKNMVAEDDKVSTIHLIDAVTTTGNIVKGKVVAHFTFRNQKIIRCEELTYFDEAQDEDKDLGSVR